MLGSGVNATMFLCDVTLHPGKLYKEGSAEARKYQRLTAGGEHGGGAGMSSVQPKRSASDALSSFTGRITVCADALDGRPKKLGEGVFQMWTRDHGLVAVKHLRPSGGASDVKAADFRREATTLLTITRHPHVITAAGPYTKLCFASQLYAVCP